MMHDNQETLFSDRLDDLVNDCINNFTPQFTKFLDGRNLTFAENFGRSFKEDVITVSFGGFSNAERRIVGFFPQSIYGYASENVSELFDLFGLCYVKITGSGYRTFTHRDFLGSVLSLGIKREAVGDIYVAEDKTSAYAVFCDKVGQYILDTLDTVANDKVKASEISRPLLPDIKYEFSVINGTVASVRLDSVLSEACNMSREKAKQMINSGLVSVNHTVEMRCDSALC